MTKTATVSSLQPDRFMSLTEVFFEDAKKVAEMLNWAAGKRPVTHLAMATGIEGWAGGDEIATLGLRFPTSPGWHRCLVFKIVVQPEVKSLTIGARCFLSAGQTCQLRVTVGASAATTIGTFTSADNGTEKTVTINTSSSGTGELVVTIDRNHTVGSASDCYVRNIRVEDNEVAATDLPDPADT